MQIKKMTDEELNSALKFCADIDNTNPHYSNFNFDPETWKKKFIELIDEKLKRELGDDNINEIL